MHDHVLRLDRMVGAFLDSLVQAVGPERLAVVLTADHGMAPSPEVRSTRQDNRGARRVMLDEFQAPVNAAAVVAARAKLPLEALGFDGFTLSVDRELVRGRSRDLRRVAEAFAEVARTIPGVLRVDLLDDLAKADTVRDAIARRWLHMFRPGGNEIAVVTLAPYHIFGDGNVATHGSPHDYDAHVPLVFWGADFVAKRDDGFVRVVDIAPTLADLLGVPVRERRIDGVVLTRARRGAP
jgi:arylsulfatase A-like enzyme